MNHQLKFLKVKIKSLAAEQQIIRIEKRRALRVNVQRMSGPDIQERMQLANELNNHRVLIVRPEVRATLMAYGLLRGMTAEQIEPRAKTKPDAKKVESMIKRYGTYDDMCRLIEGYAPVKIKLQAVPA